MADTIYRQEAIDELRLRFDDTAESWMEMRDLVIDTIKDLPSAQPERKTGKWETVE